MLHTNKHEPARGYSNTSKRQKHHDLPPVLIGYKPIRYSEKQPPIAISQVLKLMYLNIVGDLLRIQSSKARHPFNSATGNCTTEILHISSWIAP